MARYGLGWPWPQAQIGGIALSTTSVAVVYAVMVETGYNRTELGKIILAACFINDIGTVLAFGLIFANYNLYLLLFAVVTIVVSRLPWIFPGCSTTRRTHQRAGDQVPFLVLFVLGGLANLGKSEAVLPAYLVAWRWRRSLWDERSSSCGCAPYVSHSSLRSIFLRPAR